MDRLTDLTPVIVLLLSGVLAVLTGFMIRLVKTKLDEDQRTLLNDWIHIAVYAAEKMYGDGRGQEKLAYVKSLLEEKGYTVDIGTLEALVNAELQEMMSELERKQTGSGGWIPEENPLVNAGNRAASDSENRS